MSQIAEKKFPITMLLGGLSVNLNHLKIHMKYWSSKLILFHTDRQTPRQYPQKIQTASSILSAFSEGLNLTNIPKIHLSTPVYRHAMSIAGEGQLVTPWLQVRAPSYCLCFTSLALWLISNLFKGNFMASDYLAT